MYLYTGGTMDKKIPKNKYSECNLSIAIECIGGKWRLPIIWALYKNEYLRFNQLKREIEGITPHMLTQSLKDLESFSVINRTQYNEIPPKVEYSLSQIGLELIPILIELSKWGKNIKRSL
jgi:DNA-binding HxlR family transcriptional regulator